MDEYYRNTIFEMNVIINKIYTFISIIKTILIFLNENEKKIAI